MKYKKLTDIIGTLILFAGMLIAFSSHAFHARIGLGEEASHLKHVIYGITLVIAALVILVYNNNALRKIF